MQLLERFGLVGGRREIGQRRVRPHRVVVLAPGGDDGAGLVERGKPVLVQTLLAQTNDFGENGNCVTALGYPR